MPVRSFCSGVALMSVLSAGQALQDKSTPMVAYAAATPTAMTVPPPNAVPTFDPKIQYCLPMDGNSIDESAPCRLMSAEMQLCTNFALQNDTAGDEHYNNSNEQDCYCKAGQQGTQFFEHAEGCMECKRLHGTDQDWIPAQEVATMSAAYCAIAKPTAMMEAYFIEFGNLRQFTTINPGTSTVTDVLGTKTAVSLYYTASSTPSATKTASATHVTSTSEASSDKQLVQQGEFIALAIAAIAFFDSEPFAALVIVAVAAMT